MGTPKRHEMRSQELAMRVLLFVEPRTKRPDFLMSEIVPAVRDRFDVSRAQAFRLVRCAIDVLCVNYDQHSPGRMSKFRERVGVGTMAGLAEEQRRANA